MRPPVSSKTASNERIKRILALVPARDAGSDASDGSSSDDECKTPQSSPAPSLDASFERLNILESSDHTNFTDNEIDREIESSVVDQDQFQAPLTPVLDEVFPSPSQCNYEALPSISSLPSLPSVQPTTHNSTLPSTSSPLVTRAQRKRAAPTILARKTKKRFIKKINLSFHWKNLPFQHTAEIQNPVFQEAIPCDWSPLDYFYNFFPKELIASITDNTNLYSVQETGKSIEVSNDEILDFLAINIMMGIVVMPFYKDYWKTSFRYAKVADVMSVKRYQQIRRFIHFTDNTSADLQDRYYKLRPLIDSIRNKCLLVEEENSYSIDEMVIPYKGKKAGSRRQYNPNKPSKWEFKNLVRAGVSGIIYDFMLYAGDDTFRGIQFTEEEESLGVGSKIVVALCKTLKNKASVVYFDNYFTSLELVYLLRENYGIFSLGTIRQNRLKDATGKLLTDKTLKKKGRGAFSQVVCNKNKLSIVKWFDTKQVTLVSSYVDAHPLVKIKRFSKESKTRVDVTCPQVVKHYNRHMGGVDLADMLIALYRTGIKSHRWYMNIFSQLIDICINNGWLLRRRHDKMGNVMRKKDHLKEFRYEVFMGLLKRDREVAVRNVESVSEKNKIKKPVAETPSDQIQYDKFDHWPQLTSYQRCKYCKTGQASTMCTKCKVHLCYVKNRNCFWLIIRNNKKHNV